MTQPRTHHSHHVLHNFYNLRGLSGVHLRNAPPNPSNYAQRSGRAGRNGQGALIFTYCSSYAPHDRHYFQNQAEIVAGAVQPPRFDLCNRELLLTHVNAVAIGEIGLPALEPADTDAASLTRLIVEDELAMPLSPGVRDGLKVLPRSHAAILATFQRVIQDFEPRLSNVANPWYSDSWAGLNLDQLADHLNTSMDRWRNIYRSARALLSRATRAIDSGRLSVGSPEYKKHKRNQDQAQRQIDLLRNDTGSRNEPSEFYPWRYLASEGFLPGYNFTRLPLRVFVPNGPSSGDFISRPRAIALREFGRLNTIYYNGSKFRVSQLIEICPFSQANLGDNANKELIHDLLEMSESRAEEIDRISCEEEERVSKGCGVTTYFSVDGGNFDRVRTAFAHSSQTRLLNLRYIPAARLYHVNKQWRAQKSEGFPIGLTSGDWRAALPGPDQEVREDFKLVKLFTSNVADALYIEPIEALGLKPNGVITLQHALKRAIETVFQVEPNEIGVHTMGDPEQPNILIYEAAEGSLGILSQFVEDPATFSRIIAAAQAICRFDAPEYLAPASYDDLLSYYNQRDHKVIDRHYIENALEKLALCKIEIQSNTAFRDYEEQYQSMLRNLDPNSSTERAFPDAAQKRLDGIYCQPDFYYEPCFWVFCDGSPHDDPAVQQRDAEQRQLILARGDEVWVWHYRENLASAVAKRSDVFRKVR